LNPSIANRAKKGEFVKQFDHFKLLHTMINWANIKLCLNVGFPHNLRSVNIFQSI
jgi:hypothetical protein